MEQEDHLTTRRDEPGANFARKKTPSRIYFGFVLVGMLLLLSISVVALGCFGAILSQYASLYKQFNGTKCVLFVNLSKTGDVNFEEQSTAPCIISLLGLGPGCTLGVVLSVYTLVMCLIGPKL